MQWRSGGFEVCANGSREPNAPTTSIGPTTRCVVRVFQDSATRQLGIMPSTLRGNVNCLPSNESSDFRIGHANLDNPGDPSGSQLER